MATITTSKPEATFAPAAMSIEQAVHYVGISRSSIYGLIRSGELPVIHFGRRVVITRDSLDALLRQRAAA
jgi:excisionase family DNA binding protein